MTTDTAPAPAPTPTRGGGRQETPNPQPGSGRAAINRARWSIRLPVAAAVATVLAAICLGETFSTGSWFLPTAFGAVFVIAACEIARRRSIPRALVPLVGLLALVVYLVLRYARGEASLGFLPDASALGSLLELSESGNKDIARYAAPISVSPGVELITVAGVGFIALLVDTLAVTMRRAALAGLPLLALYTVPAALAPDGVRWQAFALAGAGFLSLLLAESRERVSRWGRPMRFSPRNDWRDDVQTAPLAQLGRRVGAAALGIALVVPAVIPQISLGAYGFGDGGFGRGTGSGNKVSVVNPILDLGRDLRQGENRTVIRYRGPSTYLRMVALDSFDGNTWKPSKYKVPNEQTLERPLPPPTGLTAAVEHGRNNYTIDVLELDQQWLPLPYPARSVEIDGRWLYDQGTFNVFSTNTSTRNKSYRVKTRDVRPTAQQLQAAPHLGGPGSLDRYLQTPLSLPAIVAQTAKTVTSEATTDYDKALALQTWLRGPAFTYSTEVSRNVGDLGGSAGVAAFLRARRGYCVHFASTMAIMARLLEIPARVAVGFTQGARDRDGTYTVGLHDAHSWPELYFEGTGWVAFEPTPAARTGQPPAWARPSVTANDPNAAPSDDPSASSSATAVIPESRTGENEDAQGGAAGDDAEKPLWQRLRVPVIPALLVLGFLVLLTVPMITRKVIRKRRWRQAVSPEAIVGTAWTELHDTLVDFGFTWRDSDSARRGAVRVARELALPPQATEAIARLARATERLHYAPELGEVGDLRADMTEVDHALAAAASRGSRIRARLLPRSTRSLATIMADRVADVLDALDAGAGKLRSRLVLRARRTG